MNLTGDTLFGIPIAVDPRMSEHAIRLVSAKQFRAAVRRQEFLNLNLLLFQTRGRLFQVGECIATSEEIMR